MARRYIVAVMGVVQIGLLIAALRDLWRRPAETVRGSRPVWTAVCFINFVGPLAYFKFGRRSAD